jgi:hypothetical protein
MFVNRIKICPDLHKLQLWFSRLRHCLFSKLLCQWTHKMGHFLSTIKHSHPICIWYTNSRLRFEFVYQIQIGCSCFIYYIKIQECHGVMTHVLIGGASITRLAMRNVNLTFLFHTHPRNINPWYLIKYFWIETIANNILYNNYSETRNLIGQ